MHYTKNLIYYESDPVITKKNNYRSPQIAPQEEPIYDDRYVQYEMEYPQNNEGMMQNITNDYENPNYQSIRDESKGVIFQSSLDNDEAKQKKFASLPFNPETNAFSVSVIPNKPVRYLTVCEPYVEPVIDDRESNYYSFYFKGKIPRYTYKPYKPPQRGKIINMNKTTCFVPTDDINNVGNYYDENPAYQMYSSNNYNNNLRMNYNNEEINNNPEMNYYNSEMNYCNNSEINYNNAQMNYNNSQINCNNAQVNYSNDQMNNNEELNNNEEMNKKKTNNEIMNNEVMNNEKMNNEVMNNEEMNNEEMNSNNEEIDNYAEMDNNNSDQNNQQ